LPKSGEIRYLPLMSKSDEDRERRLAEALRENLRRRKAQARGGKTAERDHAETRRRED
jgi:hypothetical protein